MGQSDAMIKLCRFPDRINWFHNVGFPKLIQHYWCPWSPPSHSLTIPAAALLSPALMISYSWYLSKTENSLTSGDLQQILAGPIYWESLTHTGLANFDQLVMFMNCWLCIWTLRISTNIPVQSVRVSENHSFSFHNEVLLSSIKLAAEGQSSWL